jgi:hypothetical protein
MFKVSDTFVTTPCRRGRAGRLILLDHYLSNHGLQSLVLLADRVALHCAALTPLVLFLSEHRALPP